VIQVQEATPASTDSGATIDPRLLLMHQVMLGDRPRLQAYRRALQQVIRPGDIVVDIGAGTVILSMLALRHGAARVYAIEADPGMLTLANRIVEHNNLQGQISLVAGDARTVRLPEQADLLVCEMMGNLGPEEEMAESVRAVSSRHLRPDGRIVPRQLTAHLQAIELDHEGWGVWRDDFLGYSLSPVQEHAPSAAQLHFFSRDPKALSAPATLVDQRLGTPARTEARLLRLPITSPGRLQAVMGYFTASLAPDISLSNFPSYPGCNWAVWIWPLRHTDVVPGDLLTVEVRRPLDVRRAEQWRLDCRIARKDRRL
jgi:protein arginine N-methyltransferase 1